MKNPRMTMTDERDRGELTGNGRRKVLVMDDEPYIRNALKKALEILGYRAALARNGSEAVDLYRKAKEDGEPFDAVLMDLMIAEGMGGEETIQKLRGMDPTVRAVISSVRHDSLVMLDFRNYGFQGALRKPLHDGAIG